MYQTQKLSLEEEKVLVEKAKKNPQDFEPLYCVYLPKIYKYSSFKTHSVAIAEDLTAQTFCEALENLHKFTWRGVSFGAWLYKIAYNLLMDHYKKPVHEGIEEHAEMVAQEDVIEDVHHSFSLEKVYDALKLLPETLQQIVTLRITEEMSHREIGLIVGKSEDVVKVSFYRAVRMLKEKIIFILLLYFFVFIVSRC